MQPIDPFSMNAQRLLNEQYLRELAGPHHFDYASVLRGRSVTEALESAWLADELRLIDLSSLPRTIADFEAWYRMQFREQLTVADAFFERLAFDATLEELAVYILYEEQVDGRFDDVIALAQLGLTGASKMALAHNYWDEMGSGRACEMHTTLFQQSASYFRQHLEGSPLSYLVRPNAEALANGNLLLLLAIRRQYCARLLGALTLLEHTAPKRFSRAVTAMRRLGVPDSVIYYHELHISVDAKHGDDLLQLVVMPLLEARPDLATEVAIGVQMRLQVANRYYEMLSNALATRSTSIGAPQ